MKNTYIIIGAVVIVAIIAFFVGSRDQVVSPVIINEEESTSMLSGGTYSVDLEKSYINWSGDYTNGSSQSGKVYLSSGSLSVANTEPSSGNFEIDIQSIKSEDNIVLDNYLKMPDFLDADNYPVAKFSITRILPNPVVGTTTGKYIVDGRLTIKNIEKPISFPIEVKQVGNRIIGHSSFALNRAEWEIKSGDKAIKNAFSVELYIEAVKE